MCSSTPFDDPRTPFDIASGELRRLGITLSRLPGEYCVNFCHASEKTARFAEDFAQAVAIGRSMAAERTAEQAKIEKPRWRGRGRARTPKELRRRFIRRHNRRVRKRALRKQRGEPRLSP